MPRVFLVVGMALGVALRKVCGMSTDACQWRNRGGVPLDDAGALNAAWDDERSLWKWQIPPIPR
jgi:hypothetical protein